MIADVKDMVLDTVENNYDAKKENSEEKLERFKDVILINIMYKASHYSIFGFKASFKDIKDMIICRSRFRIALISIIVMQLGLTFATSV